MAQETGTRLSLEDVMAALQSVSENEDKHYAELPAITSSIFQQLGLPTESDLSEKCQGIIEKCAALAVELDMDVLSPAAYTLAFTKLIQQNLNLVEGLAKLRERNENLEELLQELSVANANLEAVYRRSTSTEMNKTMREKTGLYKTEIKFLEEKCRQYEKQIASFEHKLKKCGGNHKDIQHSTLVERGNAIKGLDIDIAKLEARIARFSKLPPNITEAKLVIERKRQELQALDEQVAKAFAQ